jgi:hypothetical protein
MEGLILNVQDVVLRVKRTFGDEAGVQVTDQDIIRWINDAQEEIVLTNEGLMETTAVSDAVANQTIYSLPDDFSVLRSLKYKDYRLKSLSLAEFNEYIDGYGTPTTSGQPEYFTVWESQISVYPKPSESVTGAFSIYYMRHPESISNLADALTVPLVYHTSVVDYCLQQAYELDEDFQKAQIKKGKFDESMMKLNDRNKWVSQEYYPRITTLPEDENFSEWGGFY